MTEMPKPNTLYLYAPIANAAPVTPPTCSNCCYSLKPEVPKSGVVDLSQVKSPPLLCRRYPPQAQALPTHQGVAVITVDFPQTAPDSWCGEHKPRENANN